MSKEDGVGGGLNDGRSERILSQQSLNTNSMEIHHSGIAQRLPKVTVK